MDAIQEPIVAVIGDMIRQYPGTISLGQGVVHYGPPPGAVAIARDAIANPDTHVYQDGSGNRALLGAIEDKLRRDNGIDVNRGSRVMVTAGGNARQRSRRRHRMAWGNVRSGSAQERDRLLDPSNLDPRTII